MARPEGHRDCRYLIETIRTEGISELHVVPTLLRALVEEPGFEQCRSLRRIFSAGEALPRALVDRVRAVLDVEVVNLYGPTEGNVDTFWRADPDPTREFVPIGRPIANTHVYVLDAHLQPAPIGVPGELYVGGAGLARGYVDRPDLTAERFIRDPFSADANARLYKTGDRGRLLPDGNFEYLGRLDDQIKLRGFRIELGEIEAALKEHPAIRDAAVVLRDNAAGDKRLVAFIIYRDRLTAPVEDVRRALRARLPEYMIPSAFMPLEALPVTASGKVDRRSLPSGEVAAPQRSYAEAQSPTEAQLVRIWETLLGVRPIGVTDNFFDLGGHSLLAARLVAAVEHELGKRLPLSALFEDPTVRHAAEVLLSGADGVFAGRASVIHADGTRPPFFFLHGDYAAGGVYCRRLADALGPAQPLVALHPHGLDGGPIPSSIEDMAADQLQNIRAMRAHGPYQLGGYCNGGQIAFEIARQLRAQGERVTLLFLVEASLLYADASLRAAAVLARAAGRLRGDGMRMQVRLVGTLRRFMYEWPRLPGHYRRRIAWWFMQERPERINAIRRRGRRLRDVFTASFHPAAADPQGPLDVNKTHLQALLGYVAARYDGPITVVRAADTRDPRPDLGWRAVTDELTVYTVPGDHVTCVAQHVADLGGRLAACLEAAQEVCYSVNPGRAVVQNNGLTQCPPA
jgi:thioesterase domain-containing protein/acyl carrier protein